MSLDQLPLESGMGFSKPDEGTCAVAASLDAGCQLEKRSPAGSPRHDGVDHADSLETAGSS